MLRKVYKTILLIVVVACFGSATMAQTVRITNTEITEGQTKVVVSYDISPVDDDKIYTTSLFLSVDGGVTFQPLKAVSGNIGELKQLPVSTQKVTWDIFKDVAELSGAVKFEIRLTTKAIPLPLKQVVMYVYSPSAPVGAMYARFRKLGWYGCFKSNFKSAASDYDASTSGLTNYDGAGYWQIGSESKVARLAITGGGIYKLRRNIYAYGGLGFGSRALLWQYTSFKADDTEDKSGFARVTETSYSGIEIEAGCLYFIHPRVPVSFGINTVNGGFWDIHLGFGFSF